jgi:hypothetical protein
VVCFRYIIVNNQYKGDGGGDDNNSNSNNNSSNNKLRVPVMGLKYKHSRNGFVSVTGCKVGGRTT